MTAVKLSIGPSERLRPPSSIDVDARNGIGEMPHAHLFL